MRYTIEGFSQTEAIKFRRTEIVNGKEKVVTLDCTDLVILRWFVDFWPNMMKVEISGQQYAWLSYKDAIEDMPLLGIKKAMFALRLKKMVDFGILSHKTVKRNGTFSYYGFGPEYGRLIDTDHTQQNSDPAQNIDERVHKKLDTHAQNFSDQINSSTREQINIPFPEIIDYLNSKAGTRYRPTTAKTQSSIRARWNEGYRLDDFRRVIDVKCAEWKGTDFEKYLCPDTLFGTKFEKYLNQPMKQKGAVVDEELAAYGI